ncbi:hypothetical protein CMO93_02985 [Candidatus Woesearchaeota archaeon]|nr:hypothetical protein [Candidatus Woesearchaeota archaeon]|tara:strand:+ start:2050 stop:2451 length:402 start_codon:yes stop_codon:yes gene_type:complete
MKWNIIFLIIGVILFILVVGIFSIPMPYAATEEYIEKEPYTAQESYTEQAPYVAEECETEIPTGIADVVGGLIDAITGNEPFQDCNEVTKYRIVTKYRTVTKYRDVIKTRSVTKYATLFQQWTGKVKWYYEVD